MKAQLLSINQSRAMAEKSSTVNLYLVAENEKKKHQDPDLVWVHKAKLGDSKAFEMLFNRNFSRVTGICNRMLNHKGEVEDAVQQTFLKAWQSLEKFEERSLFSTWLTRIAMYTCLNIRRRFKRLFLTDSPLDYLSSKYNTRDETHSPIHVLSDKAYLKACDQVLQKLSVKRRAVFVLSDLEDYRCSEIADILNIPAATARTRLFHARKDFAKLSKEHVFFKEVFSERMKEIEKTKGCQND